MKRDGFSLVQLIIYLALLLLITLLVSSFISTLYKNTCHYNKQVQQKLNLYTARDLLVQDLKKASPQRKWWILKDNEMIFRRDDSQEDIGWIIKKKRLLRYSGIYTRTRHVWRKKVVSVVAYDVDALRFVLHEYPESSYIKFITGKLFSKCFADLPGVTVALHNKIV